MQSIGIQSSDSLFELMSVLVTLERFEHHQQNRKESGNICDSLQPDGASAAQSVCVRQIIALRLLQQRKRELGLTHCPGAAHDQGIADDCGHGRHGGDNMDEQ